jgi:hypothetical protein
MSSAEFRSYSTEINKNLILYFRLKTVSVAIDVQTEMTFISSGRILMLINESFSSYRPENIIQIGRTQKSIQGRSFFLFFFLPYILFSFFSLPFLH